jgi:nicotinate-nucleotide--dimethylbenzimidazole phosphoribosyltransferase
VDDVVPRPLDAAAIAAASERQAHLLKPPGSLGRLEKLALWLAGVTGEPRPALQPLLVIAAADHGAADEAVSAYPQAVTGQMLRAFLAGGTAGTVIADAVGAELLVVDAGVASPPATDGALVTTGLCPSANLAYGPALEPPALEEAIRTGRRIAASARARGVNVIAGGEMGIANTTPATCLAAWLTGGHPESLCGRGTGIDDAGLARKRRVVRAALGLHGHVEDPGEALRRMGGGEIAVLCGLALGAAEQGLGFVCDGLISTAAAAMAVAMEPAILPRVLAGHRSPEPAHGALLDHLELEPVLELGMRLGEGSGAAAALAVIALAAATHREMSTFEEAAVAGPT